MDSDSSLCGFCDPSDATLDAWIEKVVRKCEIGIPIRKSVLVACIALDVGLCKWNNVREFIEHRQLKSFMATDSHVKIACVMKCSDSLIVHDANSTIVTLLVIHSANLRPYRKGSEFDVLLYVEDYDVISPNSKQTDYLALFHNPSIKNICEFDGVRNCLSEYIAQNPSCVSAQEDGNLSTLIHILEKNDSSSMEATAAPPSGQKQKHNQESSSSIEIVKYDRQGNGVKLSLITNAQEKLRKDLPEKRARSPTPTRIVWMRNVYIQTNSRITGWKDEALNCSVDSQSMTIKDAMSIFDNRPANIHSNSEQCMNNFYTIDSRSNSQRCAKTKIRNKNVNLMNGQSNKKDPRGDIVTDLGNIKNKVLRPTPRPKKLSHSTPIKAPPSGRKRTISEKSSSRVEIIESDHRANGAKKVSRNTDANDASQQNEQGNIEGIVSELTNCPLPQQTSASASITDVTKSNDTIVGFEEINNDLIAFEDGHVLAQLKHFQLDHNLKDKCVTCVLSV